MNVCYLIQPLVLPEGTMLLCPLTDAKTRVQAQAHRSGIRMQNCYEELTELLSYSLLRLEHRAPFQGT